MVVKESAIRDVDAILPPEGQGNSPLRSEKLRRAHEVGRKTEAELRQLCEGLNARIGEIGIIIASADHNQGIEEHVLGWFAAIGLDWARHKATELRYDRISHLNLTAAVGEIERFVRGTIDELGKSENEYEQDHALYQHDLDHLLAKQEEATHPYLTAQKVRSVLEAQAKAKADELAGPIAEEDRPAREQAYEEVKRKLDVVMLQEKTYLAILKNANEAIPEVQKSRDSAANAIQSIHGMRQAMLEKFSDFKVILERASTAMKARARIELYESTDPAMNKAIELITANNVATAGAALEVYAQRIKQAAIDPARSKELLDELLDHILTHAQDLQEIETSVRRGPRAAPLAIEDQREKRIKMSELLHEMEVERVEAKR